MRIGVVLAVAVLGVVVLASAGCRGVARGGLFRQYEYEEEMYLSIDGSAALYVNASIPALNALRGTHFDERPNARVDTAAVRAYFTSPATHVVRVSTSRRRNRRFVHVRIAADDIRRVSSAAPFAWSSYTFEPKGELIEYLQTVGNSVGADVGPPRWTGEELVAFRIHIPSVIEYHNAGADNRRRGNILVFEQSLAERLKGVPLTLEARMQPQSILYRTLFLFGATIGAAALTFALVVWRVVRKGRKATARV